MGRAVQLQEHEMMQAREREYNQAIDQSMDNQRLQVHCLSLLPASQLQCSCVIGICNNSGICCVKYQSALTSQPLIHSKRLVAVCTCKHTRAVLICGLWQLCIACCFFASKLVEHGILRSGSSACHARAEILTQNVPPNPPPVTRGSRLQANANYHVCCAEDACHYNVIGEGTCYCSVPMG